MTKRSLSLSAVLLVAAPLVAQGPPAGPMQHGPGGPWRAPVTNAPYTATITDTSSETLQDGSALTRTETRLVERDSLGRTREEVTHPARGNQAAHTTVTIFDPVARTVTQLHPEDKVAVVHTLPTPPDGVGRHGTGRADAPPADAATTPTRQHGPHDDSTVVTTDLGSKTIAGVVASGKKNTRTVPAGTMWNSAALVSTHEEWYSPDLKIEVSRTDSDPFHGTHTMTVSGLTKAEPDAALFRVPTGYTVRQAPQHAGGRRGFGPPPPAAGEGAPPAPQGDAAPGV